MLNRKRDDIDDAPVSRTAKSVTYYCSTPAVKRLVEDFGDYLEDVSLQQKCLMGAILYAHLGGASLQYSSRDSIHCIDLDNLLEDDLTDFLQAFAAEQSPTAIADFLSAIAALVADDIRNGACD